MKFESISFRVTRLNLRRGRERGRVATLTVSSIFQMDRGQVADDETKEQRYRYL